MGVTGPTSAGGSCLPATSVLPPSHPCPIPGSRVFQSHPWEYAGVKNDTSPRRALNRASARCSHVAGVPGTGGHGRDGRETAIRRGWVLTEHHTSSQKTSAWLWRGGMCDASLFQRARWAWVRALHLEHRACIAINPKTGQLTSCISTCIAAHIRATSCTAAQASGAVAGGLQDVSIT